VRDDDVETVGCAALEDGDQCFPASGLLFGGVRGTLQPLWGRADARHRDRGIAKKYSAVELEHRILYPPDATETAVVSLPSGEKIKGRLLHLDAFYVSLMDAQGNYRSCPLRPGTSVVVDDPLRGHRELLTRYKDKDTHDIFAYLETLQ